jgi:hypothetical protein
MSLEPFISQVQPNPHSFCVCLKYSQAPVRHSSYALVGVMAMSYFVLLRPHMPDITSWLILQPDPDPKAEFISAFNNVAWSVGEFALRFRRGESKNRSSLVVSFWYVRFTPCRRARILTLGELANLQSRADTFAFKHLEVCIRTLRCR